MYHYVAKLINHDLQPTTLDPAIHHYGEKVRYFSLAAIQYAEQKQLKRAKVYWLIFPEGACSSWQGLMVVATWDQLGSHRAGRSPGRKESREWV